MKSTIRQFMIGMSSYINHFMASKMPGVCPFILVCEFPRSGGTWIRDMIGDCLQLPVPRYSLLPVTFSSLVHTHFCIKVTKVPVIYIVRDPRDVFVSHYYKALSAVKRGTSPQRKRTLKFHPSFLNETLQQSLNDSMSAFYDEWRVRPVGSSEKWGDHVRFWLNNGSDNVHMVRYDDMRKDPFNTLKTISEELSDGEVDDSIVDTAVFRNSFEYKTGRKPGETDNSASRRSGLSGAWRETLSPDLQDRFLMDFGNELKMAGYID